MAARNDVEYQSLRASLRCGRSPAAQLSTGNQPGSTGRNRRAQSHRSRVPRRSRALRERRRRGDESFAGGQNPAVPLSARTPRVGSVAVEAISAGRAQGPASSLRFCGESATLTAISAPRRAVTYFGAATTSTSIRNSSRANAVTPTSVLAGGCSAEMYLLRTSRIVDSFSGFKFTT